MRIKALHPQKHFLKFISLVILVLGASVGIVLATQKQAVFDESMAGAGCTCNSSSDLGGNKCVDNDVYVCKYNNIYNRYYFVKSQGCGANLTCRQVGCAAICGQSSLDVCDTDGDTRCAGAATIQRCTNGVWTTYKDCSKWNSTCEDTACGKGGGCKPVDPYCKVITATPTPGEYCQIIGKRCNGNIIEQCLNHYWTAIENCSLGKTCKDIVLVGPMCISISNPNPTSSSQPTVTCQYDCGTRYECNNNGGTIVGGKCGYVGEVCCKY